MCISLHDSNMSCLNNTVCDNKNHYHYEWCNFYSTDGYYYEAAPTITCTRDNIVELYPSCSNCWTGFIDCCADSREECCLRSLTSIPTSIPTSTPTPFCSQNYYFQEDERCNFLEIQNTDISYYSDNSMICCTDDRELCCPFNYTILYSVIGFLGISVIIIVSHLFYQNRPFKIIPETKTTSIIPV
jgi:hypothetical protein